MRDRAAEAPPCLAEHAQFLRALARRLVADPSAADDLVQETFLRALRQSPPALQSARGWLATVVRNVFRDQRAAERARRQREQEVARRREVETGAGDPFGIDQLTRALQALPADYRRALELRYYAQHSIAQMAAELGLPVATVKTRLHRGLALLRADLAARVGGAQRLRALLLPLAVAPMPTAGATAGLASLLTTLMLPKLAVVAVTLAVLFAWLRPDSWLRGETAAVAPPLAAAPVVAAPVLAAATRQGAVAAAAAPAPSIERLPAAVAGARVAGRIVYAATGQGVPFCRVAVRDHSHREELCTDVDGRFTSTANFAADAELTAEGARGAPPEAPQPAELPVGGPTMVARPLLILPVPALGLTAQAFQDDDGEQLLAAQAEADAAPPVARPLAGPWQKVAALGAAPSLELSVDLGPTYFIALTLPDGSAVTDFTAALARSERDHVGWLRDYGGGGVPLRRADDGRLWCRMNPLPPDSGRGFLCIWSRDGCWRGQDAVATVVGVQTEPVVVALQACGVVQGTVRDRAGRPLAHTWVDVVRAEATAMRSLHGRSDRSGQYRITHVPPGPARLEVAGELVEPWRLAIDVVAGQVLERDIVLDTRPVGGRIAGTIATASGERFACCSVILTSRNDSSIWRTAGIDWQRVDGRMQATFAFADVPLVECEVALHTFEPCGVPVRSLRVTPPSEQIAFWIEDRLPLLPVRFRVDGGDPAQAWSIRIVGEQGWCLSCAPASGATAEVQLPAGQSFAWQLTGQGVRARRGTARVEAGAQIVVPSTAGWSVQLWCTDIANYYAARDVAVFADDVPVGRTDEQGALVIDLPAAPHTLTFDIRVWRVFDDAAHRSDLDGATGTIRPDERGARLHAYLQRVL